QRASDLPVYIASIGIEATDDSIDLDWIFEHEVLRRIERLQGVARVDAWGLAERWIEVQLDRDRVDAYGIDLLGLIAALQQENVAVTAGRVREGDREWTIRFDGRFQSLEDVEDLRIAGGMRIGDFARVGYARGLENSASRVNGKPSRVLVVSKEAAANTIEVCERIERELETIRERLRESVAQVESIDVHAWLDQGSLIRASVSSLGDSALIGAACAIVVLLVFFRRIGLTVLVTLSIPFSLLITIVWMHFAGRSFNLLSLMGLSLGIGMLVDNSIVVVENILRYRERGLSPRQAALEGVREVGLAVTLATLTTIMVLLPILFLSDERFRGLTQELGAPLCVSVLASLLVALIFIPQGVVLVHARARGREPIGPVAPDVELRVSAFNRATARVADWCLGHRLLAFVLALGLLATAGIAYRLLPKSSFNMDGPPQIEMRLELPRGTTIEEANGTFAFYEEALRTKAEAAGIPIRSITAWFDPRGGDLRVFFPPGEKPSQEEFFRAIDPLPVLPGVTCHLGHESFTRGQSDQRLRVFIQGNDYDRVERAESIVREALGDRARFPQLGEIARWSEVERDEVIVEVDRRAAQVFGVDTANVSRMLAWALRGALLPDFILGDREYQFRIAYDDYQKEDLGELDSVLIHRPEGTPVRLDNVARYRLAPGSGDIHRRDGKITAGLSAGIRGGLDPKARGELQARVEQAMRSLALPEGCEIVFQPGQGGFEDDLKSTVLALQMAVALVFFVMGLLFESWLLPLSILLSVPFAFLGSAWALVAFGVALDAVGMIGMLMLVGVVVNNAIVLVDMINRTRAQGLPRRQAIVTSVHARFRPIWMTALTTIFGLVPLAVSKPSGDSVDYRALAVVMMGGLASSTIFTLLLVPVLYTVLDDVQRILRALFRWR
ncbi:MAG TPA: efflux RND transporter permease subunit, partial [Planctomycetota bacterium]|nr:efflux RND transporter permease subunit [Planctomycetota bacterium]